MQIIFRYFDTQTGLPVSGSAWAWYCIALFVLCGAAYAVLSAPLRARKDTPFEADVRPSGGGREEAAEIKPQDLIRLIPSEGVFPVRSARHGRRFPFS